MLLEAHLPAVKPLPAVWRQPLLALALTWLALPLLFLRDWAAMFDQWWNISTYTHVLLIPPIIGWLVWQRLPQLGRMVPQGWWPGLVLFGFAVLLWALGALANFNLARQTGAVAMLITSALAVLGPKLGRALFFPLFYMIFLVPFGDDLVPALQMVTAKMTIALVHFTQIPATIDGVFINTPAGLFEVAEACSGVKFLIAMIAFGVLACHVCFRSWKRRAGFMALCIVAPILANGVRAWGTIYLAQHIGAEAAGGIDHIIYGWLFFALVIAVVIAMGWRFFDRDAAAPMVDLAAIEASPLFARLAAMQIGLRPALLAMALVVLAGTGWAKAADRLAAQLPAQVHLPQVPGWQRIDYAPATPWEPRASGAEHRLLGRYADSKGHQIDVFFALYANQSSTRKAGGFGEGALTPGTAWQWLSPGPPVADAQTDRLRADTAVERLAETRYRTGALLTGSNARLKLANVRDRLLLRAEPTMLLILSAENAQGNKPQEALAAFRQAAGPMDRWMDGIGGVR